MGRRFWLAVLVQVAILLSLVGIHGFTLMTGEPVLLKTAPVDPWDPLRGNYIDLTYQISGIVVDEVTLTGWPYREGQRVWVTLQKGQPYWTAVALSDQKPRTGPDQVALRGRVEWMASPTPGEPAERIWLRYGIEQFYIPEGQGDGLGGRQVDMEVEALVDSTGRAALRTVYLDGKPIDWR